jgi:hypothetical protein
MVVVAIAGVLVRPFWRYDAKAEHAVEADPSAEPVTA